MEQVIKGLERRAAVAQREMNQSLMGMTSFIESEDAGISDGTRNSYTIRRDILMNGGGDGVGTPEVKVPESETTPNTAASGVTPNGNTWQVISESN